VGFIKDLPQDLVVAFRATLEELESADLLLHVIDISNPRYMDQIRSVEKILVELELHELQLVRVLNKQDLVDKDMVKNVAKRLDGIPISANRETSLMPLVEELQKHFI
jgi:GTP-binding protein HflX